MSFSIYNGTAHSVSFYKLDQVKYDPKTRKHYLIDLDNDPYLTLESDGLLNCSYGMQGSIDHINFTESPIPLGGSLTFKSVDSLPDGYDVYIVSDLYRSACKELSLDVSKLATINKPVYLLDTNGIKPLGCLELSVG